MTEKLKPVGTVRLGDDTIIFTEDAVYRQTGPKLKPCPFCGETPAPPHVEFDKWCVHCPNYACGVKPWAYLFDTAEEAIKAWNTRKGEG